MGVPRYKLGLSTCKHCGDLAVPKYSRWLCNRHHRYLQMCAGARTSGKAIPSYADLDAMPGSNLVCPVCDVTMGWFKADLGAARVASLQHYRDGTMAIICISCNARHAAMDEDDFRSMPKDHKKCPKCNEVKPHSEFYPDRSRPGPMKISSHCKSCMRKNGNKWLKANREYVNALARARYHEKKGQV